MGANIHASCVVLGRAGAAFGADEHAGLLLLGPSGAGKSDLALRLIAAGAELVADDRTELRVAADALIAAPPARLAGLIEVRNLGIVRLPYRQQARIAVAIDLAPTAALARLPEPERWPLPPGLAGAPPPPLIRINPFEASAPVKVALAAAAFAGGLFAAPVAPL